MILQITPQCEDILVDLFANATNFADPGVVEDALRLLSEYEAASADEAVSARPMPAGKAADRVCSQIGALRG